MTNEQRAKAIEIIMENTIKALKNAKTDEEKLNIMKTQNMMISGLF